MAWPDGHGSVIDAIGFVAVLWLWCVTACELVQLRLDLRDARQLHVQLPDDFVHLRGESLELGAVARTWRPGRSHRSGLAGFTGPTARPNGAG